MDWHTESATEKKLLIWVMSLILLSLDGDGMWKEDQVTKSRNGRQRAESRLCCCTGRVKEPLGNRRRSQGWWSEAKGKRTGWRILVWAGEQMKTGMHAFVAGLPGAHHSAGHKVIPTIIPCLPSPVSWFTNFYSSFKDLVACLFSLP